MARWRTSAQSRLARIIDVLLADNRRSWRLDSGRQLAARTEILESVEGTMSTFAVLEAATAL